MPSTSAWRRSGMLGNMVVPPDMTMLARRSFLTSRSQSSIVFLVSSCRPIISLPSREGLNISSGTPYNLIVHSDNGHIREL